MWNGKLREKEERDRLADEIAGLRAEVKALRSERDQTGTLNTLKREINDLEISKSKLVEANDRKMRETEHSVGLLKVQQDHEVANATREAIIKVQEENLSKDKERFEGEMKFQREHFDAAHKDSKEMMKEILKRLPNINTALTLGNVAAKAPAAAEED